MWRENQKTLKFCIKRGKTEEKSWALTPQAPLQLRSLGPSAMPEGRRLELAG